MPVVPDAARMGTAGNGERRIEQTADRRAAEALARAETLLAQGRHAEARALCLQALRRAPDDPAALHQLGVVEREMGHLNVAERVLRRAATLRPREPAYAAALGALLVDRGAHADAATWLTRAIDLDPLPASPWRARGLAHVALGRVTDAERDLRQAVARAPDDPEAHDALGGVLAALGREDEAIRSFERAIRARPSYAPAHEHLGELHLRHGRIAQATRCFEHAVQYDPSRAGAHALLGDALHEQGMLREALDAHRRAQALAPDDARQAARVAAALHALHRDDETEEVCRNALARAPGNVDVTTVLARLLDWQGRYQEGIELIEPLATAPDAPVAARVAYARLLSRVYRTQEAIAWLEPFTRDPPRFVAAERRALEFALGDLHDAEGRYERAFACYERGNRLRTARFDAARLDADVTALCEVFSTSRLERVAHQAPAAPDLVFVVGLPGAGTTLAMQVLAAHPHVVAVPEPLPLARVAAALAAAVGHPYPGCVRVATKEAIARAAAFYRASLPPRRVEARYSLHCVAVDFLHLGLIELLFPRALVVHCARDELDAALSAFTRDSIDPALGYAGSLRGIAAFTHAHRRVMAHWRATLRTPIYELRYEALVREPEREVRGLTNFLGLTWNEGCVRFHESRRAAALAPARVRRPFHTSSIGRHARYARELAPLVELLRPA
jgi:tetratricopeptide (TPR) repeat protein